MNIAEFCIRKKTITLVFAALLVVGGVVSYRNLPRLEDPEFTIKTALVLTPYPGATAEEVEEEVTDVIERAAQQLGQLKRVKSKSERGLSTVEVEIKDKYDKRLLPQVWDELRRKIDDAQGRLPPGAGPSLVNDDFGDVYGVYVAVTGDGYSYAEIKEYAKLLQRELLLVEDVKKIELYGVQPEVVYVKMSRQKLAQLGISEKAIFLALAQKNLVANAGDVKVGPEYIPIDPTGAFQSVQEMGDLLISEPGASQQVYLGDVATIERGYRDPATVKLRFDGQPAVGLAISTIQGGNVVKMGEAMRRRMIELEPRRPIGMELHVISLQSDAVTQSVRGFVVNLLEAVAIVVVVLLIFMGLRSGLLIGAILFLTICGTFVVMGLYQITLERISLGALIIALGMLVDNAIVVTEGILIRIQQGQDPTKAASAVVQQNMIPLFGATVIAVLAFGAVGLSQDSTGEYCRSLFLVLLISLMLSWVTAITITPLLCVMFLKGKAEAAESDDPYGGAIFQAYKRFLKRCIRHRWVTVAVAAGLLAISIFGFGFVEQSFFPPSTRPQFMIDFWLPQGTHIDDTEIVAEKIENYLIEQYPDDVEHVTTFVGQGGSRFLLVYSPEKPDSAYAQLLVTVNDYRSIDEIAPAVQKWLEESFSDAVPVVKKFLLGPGEGGKIQLRISGRDPKVLRRLTDQAMKIIEDDGGAVGIRSDWRQRSKVVRPVLSEARARRLGVTRADLARAFETAYTGTRAGVYREGDNLLPIIARRPESERGDVNNLNDIQVFSPAARKTVPVRQVTSGFKTVWEDPIIWRRNRLRTVTVHCDQRSGNASILLGRIRPRIETMEVPPGCRMEWGGEYESSKDAQAGVAASIPSFLLLMVLVVVCLFNALRQPAIIWLCVPLAMIGITFGLLLTRQPFGFMALLAGLALSGMLIKNSIVLLDQIGVELSEGKEPFQAIVDSGTSRMRPVLMAAVTTVMGMIPLVIDAFFKAMAVTIMFGLAFATVLTLIVVPVLYAIFFRVQYPQEE